MKRTYWVGAVALLALAGGAAVVLVRPATLPAPEPPRCCPVTEASYRQIAGSRNDAMQIYRLTGSPLILVVDFPSLGAQGRMLNRIAALIEKSHAPRDRVVDEAELARLIVARGDSADTFYFGHDYDAAALTHFFNLAPLSRVELNPSEILLRNLLVAERFMIETPAGYRTGEPAKALVSVSQPQPDDPATPQDEGVDDLMRAGILRHELSHGEFFTNARYRDYVADFWQKQMTEEQREGFRHFLREEDYDVGNDRLMMNEMQAYLMNTPDPRLFHADWVGLAEEALESLRVRFLAGDPPSVLFAAERQG